MNASVSREAVPLPIATALTLCSWTSPLTILSASSRRSCGGCGYMTAVASSLPVGSTTAIFDPVRKPGSMPNTVLPPTGDCIRRFRRFLANTPVAWSSAFSVSALRVSRSIAGHRSRVYPSSIARSSCSLNMPLPSLMKFPRIADRRVSSGLDTLTFNAPLDSPRFIARILWGGIFAICSS